MRFCHLGTCNLVSYGENPESNNLLESHKIEPQYNHMAFEYTHELIKSDACVPKLSILLFLT